MITKGIMATTLVDRHNCCITKEALEEVANDMCNSSYVPNVGIEHDISIMPIGKVLKGEIIPYGDGEFALQMYSELFENYNRFTGPEEEIYYRASSKIDYRPFADTKIEGNEKLRISLDPVNFEDNDYVNIKRNLSDVADIETFTRKALVPDPTIVVQLLGETFLFWMSKKVIDKFSDKVAVDIANSYDHIKKALNEIAERIIPRNRPITYVFKECDEEVIELVIITKNTSLLLDSIQPDKIKNMINETKNLDNFFGKKIAKIQFLFNESKNKWEFNYLTTDQGEVIGTEKCYEKTKRLKENYFSATRVAASCSFESDRAKNCISPNDSK